MPEMEFTDSTVFFDNSRLPNDPIHWTEAKNHIGELVSIYGEVKSVFFDWNDYERFIIAYQTGEAVPGPTFIEVGEKYPSKTLVRIVIWGKDRNNFDNAPDVVYKDQRIVFTGIPYLYNGIVTVEISSQSSIYIVDNDIYVYTYTYRPGMHLIEGQIRLIEPLRHEMYLDEKNDVYELMDYDYEPSSDVIDTMYYGDTEWHFDENNGWLDFYPED